jgi:hypothetical protein
LPIFLLPPGCLLAFLLLLSFAIKSNQDVEYISLENGKGCEAVKTRVSDSFLLDTNGEGRSGHAGGKPLPKTPMSMVLS